MDTSKWRAEERISLLEQQLIDRCDEISEISFSLLHLADSQLKARRELRLLQLRAEMSILWYQYTLLVTTKVPDLHF
jgi:hypothetical protein